MSRKYHINTKGVPAVCRAKKGNCPFGGESGDGNHFDTRIEAQKFADQENAKKYNMLPTVPPPRDDFDSSAEEDGSKESYKDPDVNPHFNDVSKEASLSGHDAKSHWRDRMMEEFKDEYYGKCHNCGSNYEYRHIYGSNTKHPELCGLCEDEEERKEILEAERLDSLYRN